MSTLNSDKAWNAYGKKNPYFGVLTYDEFLDDNLNPENKKAFFKTGYDYVNHVFKIINEIFYADFSPQNVLDFGCGTGRLALPFAARAKHVLGVDVSENMLREAELNAKEFKLTNTTFKLSDDALTALENQTFDLVNSYIVLQHINEERGMVFIEKMIDHLNPGGIGILQLTYRSNKSNLVKRANYFRYRIPFLNSIFNVLKGKSVTEPLMQMNAYNLNNVFAILQKQGISKTFFQFEEHGDFWGVTLYFQKQ